jgi:hypothetical protein
MNWFEEILPFIVAILIAIALVLGLFTSIRKSLNPSTPTDTIDSSSQLREQQRRMDDIEDRQKQLMRDQQQRIRDLQRH